MTTPASLTGTGSAPLAATRRYSFRRVVGSAADAHLVIPVVHRTSCEDLGEVERTEQQAFVQALLSELGIASRAGFPGEWLFEDAATLDRAWSALGARLRKPEKLPPRFEAERELTPAEMPRVLAALEPRFAELVRQVAGVAGEVESVEESGTLSLASSLGDGREVRASARRAASGGAGGRVAVVVQGVLDGAALAERFLASL